MKNNDDYDVSTGWSVKDEECRKKEVGCRIKNNDYDESCRMDDAGCRVN